LMPTEANVRILSALAGLMIIPIVGIYLASRYNRRVALWGMLFVAIAPVQVYYSQEARPYSLSTLFTVVSLLVVLEIERKPSPRSWLMFVAIAILSIYLNYFSVLILLAQIIWLSMQPGIGWQRNFLFSLLLIGVVCLPLLPNALISQQTLPEFNRADSFWPITLQSTLASMLIGDIRYVPRLARWVTLTIFAILGLVAVIRLRSRSLLYLLMLGLPMALVLVLLPVAGLHPPHYQEKQFTVLAPTAWALAAVGIQTLWERRSALFRAVVIGLVVSWVIFASIALSRYFGEFVKSHEKLIVNWLRDNRANQEPILIVGPPGVGGAIRYYAPEVEFLALRRYTGTSSLWTPASDFVMVPFSQPATRCSLANVRSSSGFLIVEYVWLKRGFSFVNAVREIRPLSLLVQIGNWQIYYVPSVLGGAELRCDEVPNGD
ncbi:MAG: glycosyltransferase family 39 protein, partial [Gemmatales bacterium]|nr:glycosyltransferase family 39 protein [Gemmatales bacterium]